MSQHDRSSVLLQHRQKSANDGQGSTEGEEDGEEYEEQEKR